MHAFVRVCTCQINSVACTPSGRVYVGDQGQAILEFDLRNPHLPTGGVQGRRTFCGPEVLHLLCERVRKIQGVIGCS